MESNNAEDNNPEGIVVGIIEDRLAKVWYVEEVSEVTVRLKICVGKKGT